MKIFGTLYLFIVKVDFLWWILPETVKTKTGNQRDNSIRKLV